MKFTIQYKDPDAIREAFNDFLKDQGYDWKEYNDKEQQLRYHIQPILDELHIGEYLTLEVDTSKRTVRII